jgi:hypothetical protein
MLIEHRVFGALQLILAALALVDGLHHHGAGAGRNRAPHASLVDQVLGRGRDQRILQRQRTDARGQVCGHLSPHLRHSWA